MSQTNQPKTELATWQPGHLRPAGWWYGIVVVSFAVLQIGLQPTTLFTYQEAVNLQVSALIQQGYEPYREVFTLSSPVFIALLKLLGDAGFNHLAFYLTFLGFGLLLLLNVMFLATSLFNRGVGLATGLLLATAVTFLADAAAILPIVPALSLGTGSLLLLWHYFRTQKWGWLWLSGLVWAIAFWLSVAVFSLLLFALLLTWIHQPRPTAQTKPGKILLKIILGWLVGVVVGLGLGFALINWDSFFTIHLPNHLTLWQRLSPNQVENFRQVGQFLVFNTALSLLAVYGLSQVYNKPEHPIWLIFIWLLSSFIWLMVQVDLWPGDLAILLPPLAIIAGWGAIHLLNGLKAKANAQPALPKGGQKLAVVGLLVIYLLITWQQFNGLIYDSIDTENDLIQFNERPEMIAFIQQKTNPQDCVYVDDPSLALAANRLPAPWLVGLTDARVRSGLISEAEVEQRIQQAGCPIAVFYRRQYHRHLISVRDWASDYYTQEQRFQNTSIYYNE